MQENSDAPCVGKAFNRTREIEFFSLIGELHSAAVLSSEAEPDGGLSLERRKDCERTVL